MKVGTPFGEYPFVFGRVERRGGTVAIIGTVAGVESSVVFGTEDAARMARLAAGPVAVAAVLLAYSRARR